MRKGISMACLPVDLVKVRSGDSEAMVVAAVALAGRLFGLAGSSVAFPHGAADVSREEGSARAGLLAAAMELRDLLAQSPQGRQALRDLGFEPVFHDVEGE